MGNTYMVKSWVKDRDIDEYDYMTVYAGEDFDEAMKVMKAEKAKGVGCVKLEWR